MKFVYASGKMRGMPLDPNYPPFPEALPYWKKFLKWLDKWGNEIALLFYLIDRGIVIFGGGSGGGFRTKPQDVAKNEIAATKQAGL
jgi:hypothetical protein